MIHRPFAAAIATLAAATVGVVGLAPRPIRAQAPTAVDVAWFRELAWRHVGPYDPGAASAIAGAAGQPGVFFAGLPGGGVWTTTDYGARWRPVFDHERTGVVSAVAIARSNPSIIYTATGDEGSQSDSGLYRSSDGGTSWSRLPMDGVVVHRIVIDARNPDRVMMAATASSAASGAREFVILRSTTGGKSSERAFSRAADSSAIELQVDPSNETVAYAAIGTTLLKSTDGGGAWRPIGRGLPEGDRSAGVKLAVSDARIYAVVHNTAADGMYRSDDGAATWTRVSGPSSPSGAAAIAVDPSRPDVVYIGANGLWRSTNAGATFTSIWRSDDGGSVRDVWTAPGAPNVLAIATDAGAFVTADGGESWNSSGIQPTSAADRIVTDTAFPYRICASRAGADVTCAPNRAEGGQLSARDWRALGFQGNVFVAPDPSDAEIVFGGHVARLDRRSGQRQDVTPAEIDWSPGTDAPILFSPGDSRTLFLGSRSLWRSANAGQSWMKISPDLSQYRPSNDAAADTRPLVAGTIAAIAPSTVDARVIWTATDTGLVHLTSDAGVAWREVTPALWPANTRGATIEASHFDTNSAYLAGDEPAKPGAPRLLRTRDGGATWVDISRGLPAGRVSVVREDSFRRGLLFAATEGSVFFSFDDGDSWQSLRLNLPPAPVRDLILKDADIVIATAGRGVWVLDDITPLRQITPDVARADLFLFRPSQAWRTAWNANDATMVPTDLSRDANPPDGVALSYLLGPAIRGPVTLEVIETATGDVLRRLSSEEGAPRLAATPGLHRVFWDVRYAPPPLDSALLADVRRRPDASGRAGSWIGRWAVPGTYQVRLSAAGRSLRQSVIVRMDPRARQTATEVAAGARAQKSVDDTLRLLATALATSPPGAATTALRDAAIPLADLFRGLVQTDARPTAAVEGAVTTAIARANAALALAK